MTLYIFTLLLSMVLSVQCTTQDEIDYLSRYLRVSVKIADNHIDEWKSFKSELTLRNMGSESIDKGDWAIYFCSIRKIMRPSSEMPPELDYLLYGVKITHINGCLHKVSPTDTFINISPDGQRTVVFLSQFWMSARTDHFPNWFVVSGNSSVSARALECTTGESLDFVADFADVKQYQRYDFDRYSPMTPKSRFQMDNAEDHGKAPMSKPVIPTPAFLSINENKTVYFGTGDWMIVVDQSDAVLAGAAQFLKEKTEWQMAAEAPKIRYVKFVNEAPKVEVGGGVLSDSDEAYSLVVDEASQSATITARAASGAFYGVQSLMSLWNHDKESPEVAIRDGPRFGYRGMHIDVGRNFHSKDYIKKLLRAMAMYKMNKLHFHLTDDEGWRIEIPGLPELTQLGSRRCFDPDEKECILSQLGSGAFLHKSRPMFYTVAEYKEILAYAAAHHIEVIPEIDLPGHARAAIIAMKKRYEDFMEKGNEPAAREYLLSEPGDPSVYESVQLFTDNAVNPCLDSTFTFVRTILRELDIMHMDSNPLKTFHFGGDEVAKGAWVNSTACMNLMSRSADINTVRDIKEYFAREVSKIVVERNLNIAAWEDGLMGENETPFDRRELAAPQAVGYAWNNVWEWGVSNRAYKLANAGFQVVLCHATHLYFDHPYEAHPEERGYYWASRFTNTYKTFSYKPGNTYSNVDFSLAGNPMTLDELCALKDGESQCIPLSTPENILGMQGHLWSETVRTPEQADWMIFPRLLALAERAWHKAEWESVPDGAVQKAMREADWADFANALGYRELPRLDYMGIQYHIPQPAADLVDGKLKMRSVFPGLSVEYSVDKGMTWNAEQGVFISGQAKFRTKSATGGRVSRMEWEDLDPISFRRLCSEIFVP